MCPAVSFTNRMNGKRNILSLARRCTGWTLAATTLLVVVAGVLKAFDDTGTQWLMTFVGLAVGSGLARIQFAWVERHPKRVMVGIAALIVAQVCYLLLVWTGWRVHSALWRIWWLSMIPSVLVTHLVLLRATQTAPRDVVRKATSVLSLVSGLLVLALGLRWHLVSKIPAPYVWVGLPLAGLAMIGSLTVLVRWIRRRLERPPLSKGAKVLVIVASQVFVFALGWYVGTRTSISPDPPMMPSILASMPPEQIDRQIEADLGRLRTVAAGLADLLGRMEAGHAELKAKLVAEAREYYTPKEDDELRWQFTSILSYRSALLRLVATYSGFDAVRDPDRRARCFMLGHAAAATTYQTGLRFVRTYRDEKLQRRKLNEAEPAWGIPAGMFDRIYEGVAGGRNVELWDETSAYFETQRHQWRRREILSVADFDWLENCILASNEFVRTHRVSPSYAKFDLFLQRVREDAYTPVYAVQSMLSSWLGDTRIIQRPPLIRLEQIEEVKGRLRPGDLILERRNWFVSNAFLPGFWPHSALYVGDIDDLRDLGIADHPDVKGHLSEFLQPDDSGHPRTIIEGVSDGIVFASLEHSLHADYVAVLRPRLSKELRAQAIARAFRHLGKPYDFEFDFFTSDKLICTELLYRAYEDSLHFPLVRIMGRDTLPAVEIVRKFARERGKDDRELDFVLFLDADPAAGRAHFADEETFCGTADRPRSFNE